MFNEQMLNNLNNIPPVEELWKNEKSKYRVWILLFGIGIFLIFSLLLSSFILDLVDRPSIQQKLIDSNESIGNMQQAWSVFMPRFLILPIAQISILIFGLVYYITSIYNSYKMKTFARISLISTSIVSIGALLSLYNLITTFVIPRGGNLGERFSTPGELFRFINYFIVIFVWISTVGQVVRIRNSFLISERAEKLKNDPRYQAFLNGNFQQQPNSGFGFPFGFNQNPNQGFNNNTEQGAANKNPENSNASQGGKNNEVKAKVSEKSANEDKLSKMTLIQLKEVAKKLSISGYEKMNKKTLIETILRVSS